MKIKKNSLITAFCIMMLSFLTALPAIAQSGEAVPKYRRAAYANETVQLKNDHLQLNMFKRVGGWGWGEIHTSSGKMMYNTKPVFSSSDWYFANWVRDHVQWEVLMVFIESVSREIYWGDIDTEIDWDRYHEGITTAIIRWMVIHTEDTWRPHNLPHTWEGYINGDYDYTYPDTHNSITGKYGGMFILPDPIATNIYSILDRKKMKKIP